MKISFASDELYTYNVVVIVTLLALSKELES